MKCRHCQSNLENIFLDLGFAPPSNSYLTKEKLQAPEITYPLKLRDCTQCGLVQTEDYAKCDTFFCPDYAYFSSASQSWSLHAATYVEMISQLLKLDETSFVIEIASNDGYLLKNFVADKIPCLGIEPTDSTANAAEKIGVPVLREFFDVEVAKELAEQGKHADLICGNNVYAHVPDINSFTLGLKTILKKEGTITLEFPHLMRLVEQNQFDTVYHEHFSYLSLLTTKQIFHKAGLRIYHVEELATHGGSLRVYGCHQESGKAVSPAVDNMIEREITFGLKDRDILGSFQAKAEKVKNDFLSFLLQQKSNGKKVAAYGAAAKGNTLLNFAGVKPDLLSFVCDVAPSKQGMFMPGSHIPILTPPELAEHKPDFIIILPWNIANEVFEQQKAIIDSWGGKFVVAVPELKVLA
jgi:hypothetical protein